MDFEKMLKIAGVKHTDNKKTIREFFKNNTSITEANIDRLGFDLSIDSKTLHESIYDLLGRTLTEIDDEVSDEDEGDEFDGGDEADGVTLPVGKHNDMDDSEFDADQLEMGIEVEMEHTDDREIAKAIAKDHLAEVSDYYTRLASAMGEEDDSDEEGEDGELGDLEDLGASDEDDEQ